MLEIKFDLCRDRAGDWLGENSILKSDPPVRELDRKSGLEVRLGV